MAFFTEVVQRLLKFDETTKDHQTAQPMLRKKNKAGGIMLLASCFHFLQSFSNQNTMVWA